MTLTTTSTIVTEVLESEPKTRDNDDLLYVKVCLRMNPNIVLRSFVQVMEHRSELNLPYYESVRRCRAKLQLKRPDLRPSESVMRARRARIGDYVDYVKAPLAADKEEGIFGET